MTRVKHSSIFSGKAFFSICLVICLLVSSCAIKVAPTGGDKDVTPPKVLKSVPENFSTSFNQKEVAIVFDEYIQLKEADKQIIISPIIKPAPEIMVKNKTLIVKFEEPLKANTTYTINFGNAITDVNEGNAYDGFQYVFSTGAFVDSLAIKGRVYFADNLKTEKGILVMLYNNLYDSVFFKEQPDYFTKSDDGGNFVVRNISGKMYKIVALKETDGNYMFNSTDEHVAFSINEVSPIDTMPTELALFREEEKKLFIKNKGFAEKGKVVLSFNKPVGDIELKSVSNEKLPVQQLEFSIQKDSITLWLSDTTTSSLNFTVWNNATLIDTITVVEKNINTSKGRGGAPTAGKLTASANVAEQIKLNDTLTLTFNQPLVPGKNNLNLIELKKDSVNSVPYTAEFIDEHKRKLRIMFKITEKESYKLYIPPNSFTSIFNLKNDSLVFNFSTQPASYLGSILVKLQGVKEGNYLLQLVNEKDEMVYERKISGDGKYLFEYVNPLKYRMRLITDSNKDGKWTTGNYSQKLQPEKVIYFATEINIRSNWDLEQDWILK